MAKAKVIIGASAENTVAGSPEVAGQMAIICCTDAEIRYEAPFSHFMFLLHAFSELPRLSEIETATDVKRILGNCVFWTMFLQTVHLQLGRKGFVSKWVTGADWNARGPDTPYEKWSEIYLGIQRKTSDLNGAIARMMISKVEARQKILENTIYPRLQSLLRDKREPGKDLYTACAMYRLSLRETFEQVCSLRYANAERSAKNSGLDVEIELK